MPLVRVEVRNEYGLGAQELYGAADKDDPKALLEGVAVAGLVGILRQLGDLAEFAAEVFHDLQEQVMFTAARSHKMIVRVQHIEEALPRLEKAVMAQTSHIHFAYTAGSVWHPNIRAKCNHLIHSDLPRFIMKTYEECRDPPRLHLLDKFDTGGPGACLGRYSDPSFFKKALAGSDMFNSEKVLREKKASKTKKKGSRRRNSSISWNSGRMPVTSSNSFGRSSATESISTFHTRSRSEVIDRSLSFDMRTRPGYIECVFDGSSSKRHGDQEDNKLPISNLKMQHSGIDGSVHNDEKRKFADDNLTRGSLQGQNVLNSPSVTWDEKIEITEPNSQLSEKIADDESKSQFLPMNSDIKCVSGASLSMLHADQEHSEFSTLSIKPQHDGVSGSIENNEQSTDAIDNLTHGSLQEQNVPCFSTVTWDEKIEITEPNGEQPHNICEDENEGQLLPTSSDIEYVFGASPSMQHGDKEHKDFSAPTLKMQHRGANDCIHRDDQKIGATDYLIHGSLQEQNFPNISFVSKDEFSTSSLNMQHIGDDDSIHNDEQKEEVIDNLAYDSLKEQTIPQFSSFNWVEKTDITEPNSEQADSIVDDESEAQLPQSLEPVELEKEAALHGIFDIEDTIWVDEKIPDLPSEDDQSDEAGSETDKYLDALNTLESESETDTECQTKREVQHLSAKLKNEGLECGTKKIHEDAQNSEATNVDLVTTTTSSSNKFSNLDSSEDLVWARPPHITSVFSDPDISVVNDLSGSTGQCHLNVSGVNAFDSVISVPSSSGSSIADSQDLLDNESLSCFSDSQKPAAEVFGTSSNKFWTNGGLLGLEPSKPPDFNAPTNNSMAGIEDGANNHSSSTLMVKSHSNGSAMQLDILVKIPAQKEKKPDSDGREDRSLDIAYQNNLSGQLVRRSMNVDQAIDHSDSSQDDDMSKNNCLPLSAVTEAKLDKSENSHQSSSFSNVHQNGLTETSLMTPLAELSAVHGIEDTHSEACQDNIMNFSINFRHSVANGFTWNGSFHDDEYEPASFMKTGLTKLNKPECIEQNGKDWMEDKITSDRNPKEKLENASPLNSGAASPPLEHMKIAFHPIDGFTTSKLKLQFPGGHHFHESIKDVMFPSFHLLPEPAIMVQDIDSESDDDTFCRSSPYMSEEAMSQQSESSSEQWEPGEIPGYNDNGIYDALRRISSDESISSAFELCGNGNHSIHFDNGFKDQDGVQSSELVHHNPLFDLPTLDAVDPFKNQIERKHSPGPLNYTDAVSQLPNEPTPPPPPPLPPVEWWAIKSNFDAVGNGQDVISDGVTCPKDQVPQAAITQQPKSVSSKQSLAMDTACLAKSQDPQSNGHREANQAVNVKDMNDRGDLLLQIRTKSFSLRRTAPVRSPGPSAPTTNTKVAAMLEKAYAIRQACMGSDEGGGDESWSDG